MFCPRLCSDPSQSDPETKDFWLNMSALTEALQHQAEQNPTASYYNLVLLRYQVGCWGRGKGWPHRLCKLELGAWPLCTFPALCWPLGVLRVDFSGCMFHGPGWVGWCGDDAQQPLSSHS